MQAWSTLQVKKKKVDNLNWNHTQQMLVKFSYNPEMLAYREWKTREDHALPCRWRGLCWWESKAIDMEHRVLVPTCTTENKSLVYHYMHTWRRNAHFPLVVEIIKSNVTFCQHKAGLCIQAIMKLVKMELRNISSLHNTACIKPCLTTDSEAVQRILPWTYPAVLSHSGPPGKIYPRTKIKNQETCFQSSILISDSFPCH